jgi:hypothetical protein
MDLSGTRMHAAAMREVIVPTRLLQIWIADEVHEAKAADMNE